MGTINGFGCVSEDGYGFKQDIARGCFGGKSVRGDNEIRLTMAFDSKVALNNFANWYFNTINGGIDPFNIEMTLFGKFQDWNVVMLTDLSQELFGEVSEISFTVATVAYLDNQFP